MVYAVQVLCLVQVTCLWSVCLARGGVGGEGGERIGFGLYQSCGDRRSVGHVSVFWLRWWVGGLDKGRERLGGVMSV